MIIWRPWQTHNRATFTSVKPLKICVLRGFCVIFYIKVLFFFLDFLLNPHWANTPVCAERAATPCAANSFNGACCWRHRCLLVWYYHLPAVLNFIWIGMKRSGKGVCCRHVLTLVFFFFLVSFCSLISDMQKWLDIMFYIFYATLCLLGLNLLWKSKRVCSGSPRIRMQRAENINRPYLTHWIFVGVTSSYQMFWIIRDELNE